MAGCGGDCAVCFGSNGNVRVPEPANCGPWAWMRIVPVSAREMVEDHGGMQEHLI
jgi:hypothetical protein